MALNTIVAGRAVAPARDKELSYAAIADPQRLPCNGTSYAAVRAALFAVFGEFPVRIDRSHSTILTAMAAVAAEGAKPYELLIAALHKYGAIEIRD